MRHGRSRSTYCSFGQTLFFARFEFRTAAVTQSPSITFCTLNTITCSSSPTLYALHTTLSTLPLPPLSLYLPSPQNNNNKKHSRPRLWQPLARPLPPKLVCVRYHVPPQVIVYVAGVCVNATPHRAHVVHALVKLDIVGLSTEIAKGVAHGAEFEQLHVAHRRQRPVIGLCCVVGVFVCGVCWLKMKVSNDASGGSCPFMLPRQQEKTPTRPPQLQ